MSISKSRGSVKLLKLVEACSQTKAKMDELEQGLSNIVGLNELKLQLRKWARGMLLDERRRALGLKVAARRPPHMAFLGNPGAGKTMVARILGKLLYMVGILLTDKVTEVQRTDLVGEFVAHTGPKTRKVVFVSNYSFEYTLGHVISSLDVGLPQIQERS